MSVLNFPLPAVLSAVVICQWSHEACLEIFGMHAHHTLFCVIAQTVTNGPQLLLLFEDQYLAVQEFVQKDSKSRTSVREYRYLLYQNQ